MVLVGGQADRRPRHRQAPVEHGAIRARAGAEPGELRIPKV